jgi:hypothetical protein
MVSDQHGHWTDHHRSRSRRSARSLRTAGVGTTETPAASEPSTYPPSSSKHSPSYDAVTPSPSSCSPALTVACTDVQTSAAASGWLIEDGVPDVTQHRQMGHKYKGISGIYSHATRPMVDAMLTGMQARWEQFGSDIWG